MGAALKYVTMRQAASSAPVTQAITFLVMVLPAMVSSNY